VPQFLILSLFSPLGLTIESIKEFWGALNGIFQTFFVVINRTYDLLHMVWIAKPTFDVEYTRFFFPPSIYIVQ
jgi:hypothetical protein